MQAYLDKGLQQLCDRKDLIRPAYKGGIAVLDKSSYLAEMIIILHDHDTYVPLGGTLLSHIYKKKKKI